MKSFDLAFERLIGHEKGYANHPNDPGGETMWGVTLRVARRCGYFGPMKDLPRDKAKEIAKTEYWDSAHCDDMPFALAFQMLDATFNHGYGNSTRILQRALDVADDGFIGPVTLEALGNFVQDRGLNDVVIRYLAYRMRFMIKLSTWADFGRGWMNRIADNLLYVAEDN